MSSLRTIDLDVVDCLVDFVRGRGYVLEFSDKSFTRWFAETLDIDIDDPAYADAGGSKGKRLKRLLQRVDDRNAILILKALWGHRVDYLLSAGQVDPVVNAEARYLILLKRLGGEAEKAQGPQESPKAAFDMQKIIALRAELLALTELPPQPRGYAFEAFLSSLFSVYGLRPREAFRNTGEQIDGSFVFENETYLLEAKWQSPPIGATDLHAFHGKVEQKASWARGLFISNSGFSNEGLISFGRGKKVVCMDGLDIYDTLNSSLPFDQVLGKKVRRAAENGAPFTRVRELFTL